MLNFLNQNIFDILFITVKILLILVPLIICAAYLTLAERRIIGLMQLRKGPNIVGAFGLLQPIADGIKLIFKEIIIPQNSNKFIFILAPMITFILSLIGWAVIPFSKKMVLANINVGVLYLLAISALQVYGIIMAGWASNSKYALLGAVRSSAQIISYEVSMGLVIITVLLATGTLNLSEIIERQQHLTWWIKILLMPMAVIFFISTLAETNRLPFDLSEAETELVAGYNVEYSSIPFSLFFLGEYANMILASAFTTILFLGGYYPPFNLQMLNFIPAVIWFILKISLVLFCFIWIRATLPRYRYDQLMRLGWKIFLPITFFWVIFMAAILMYTGNLPTHNNI